MKLPCALLVVALGILAPMCGCGSKTDAMRSPETPEEKLLRIGGIYHNFVGETGQAPKSLAELKKDDTSAADVAPLESGAVVVIWGVSPEAYPQAGKTILGY